MTELAPPAPAIRNGSPLVTVVVPCFGEGRYLDNCLHSVRAQTYPHLEILVIDDAGNDDSWAVGLEHALADERVELLRTHENIGLGAVRNLGIRKARGDLLLFLDGDDWIPLDAVQNRVEALADHLDAVDKSVTSRVAGVFGDWQHAMFSAGADHPTRPSRQLTAVDLATSRGSNVFIVSAPLTRRDILIQSGGFAEGVKGGEDHLGWMRVLAMDTVFVPCEHLVAFYRQKQSSMLRASAETVAAFAVATRRWVDQAALTLPSHGQAAAMAAMTHTHAGELSVLWGRPRVQLTRVAAVGADGDVAVLPAAVATQDRCPPDLHDDAKLQGDIGFAERFLLGEVPNRRSPKVSRWQRSNAGLTLQPVDGDAVNPLRPNRERGGADVSITASTLHAGFEAAAIAIALLERGVRTTLDLSASARGGACSALALADATGITISSGETSVALQVDVLSAGDTAAGEASMLVVRADPVTPTPGSELVSDHTTARTEKAALIVPSGSSDLYLTLDWISDAQNVVSAAGLEGALTTISSAASRLLADHAQRHDHAGIVELAQAGAVICQDSHAAQLARMANPATLWFGSGTPAATADELSRVTQSRNLHGRDKRPATAEILDRILLALGSDEPG